MTLLSSWATCGWEKSSNRVKDVAVDCPESTGVTATDSDGMAVLPMASEGTVPAEDHELDDHEGSTIDASSVPVRWVEHLFAL